MLYCSYIISFEFVGSDLLPDSPHPQNIPQEAWNTLPHKIH